MDIWKETFFTFQMLSQRRTRALQDPGSQAGQSKSVEQACALATTALNQFDLDLPFLLVYLLDESGKEARLTASAHMAPALW